ncbi:hypothetical protein MP228_010806 [Amoeboaphelidium protococcarum]|nr:hypothetical protein MP228_010806 [Amoeboaphelidium protococcarum]
MMMMNEEEEVWNLENQDVAEWKDEWEQELILSTEKDVQKQDCVPQFYAHPFRSNVCRVTEWKDAQQMLLSKFFDTMEKIEPVLKTQSLMLKVLGISDMIRDQENYPWTYQRVVELILDPRQNYDDVNKYLNALEKTLNNISSDTFFL